VSNALRGRLAEFLVAQALGIAGGVRPEWDAYDLRLDNGVTIEVKSAAYLQTWAQRVASTISFSIAPAHAWDAESNTTALEARRQAQIYVFALLHHRNKATLDPTDVDQWTFFRTAHLRPRRPAAPAKDSEPRARSSALVPSSAASAGFGERSSRWASRLRSAVRWASGAARAKPRRLALVLPRRPAGFANCLDATGDAHGTENMRRVTALPSTCTSACIRRWATCRRPSSKRCGVPPKNNDGSRLWSGLRSI
jgi:hypothetical protein